MKLFKTFKETIFPTYKMNEKEKLTYDVIKMLCEQSDTDLKIAPLTGRYFMINKRLSYWAKVEDFSVSITNHKFTLTNTISSEYNKALSKMVNEFIEADRNEFEETVFQNEVELLENIKSNINSSKK
mgnify:CR=1 FL=1|jgi:hypothetical protein